MVDTVYSYEELTAIILPILQRYHADTAMLFGSYGRGDADSKSDIDLIVFGGEGFKPTDIFAIAEELHLRSGKNVDVYEIRELDTNSEFYQTVISEGVKIA